MVNDIDQIILHFWQCSLRNDFSEFDFDEAFDAYEPFLHYNCVEHGQGTFEEYLESTDSLYGLEHLEKQLNKITELHISNDWYTFSGYDSLRAILKAQYELIKETFSDEVHGENADLLIRIQNRKGLTEPQLISLFDEAIHAQHLNGNILEDCDIEELREQAEKEYKEDQEEKSRFPTRIREFL